MSENIGGGQRLGNPKAKHVRLCAVRSTSTERADTPGESRTLVEALREDAALLHSFVHPDISFDDCDGQRCVRRREQVRAALTEVPVIPDELDVERLARALEVVDDMDILPSLHAAEVAAEYARLAKDPTDEPEGIVQRAHVACSHCWCGEHHEEGR